MNRKSVTKRAKTPKPTKKKPMNNNNNNNNNGNSPVIIDIQSSTEREINETPIRAVFCLKRKSNNMREIENKEDCFILDFDPCDDVVVNKGCDNADISVISEKGQVACRDYPHPRHLCVKNQFDRTAHDLYCQLCYCFVCDKAAPCNWWTKNHCHAFDNEAWKSVRKHARTKK